MKVRITHSAISPTEAKVYYTTDELAESSVPIPLTDTPLTEDDVKEAILENIKIINEAMRRAGYLTKVKITDYLWLDVGESDVQ